MLSPTATIAMSLIISTLVGFAGGDPIYFLVSFCICTIGIIESYSSFLKDKDEKIWNLKRFGTENEPINQGPKKKKKRKRKK